MWREGLTLAVDPIGEHAMIVRIADMKLGRKILIAPGVVLAFLLVFAVSGFWGLRTQQAALGKIFNVHYASVLSAERASRDFVEGHGNAYKLISWARANYESAKIDSLSRLAFACIDRGVATLAVLDSESSSSDLRHSYDSSLAEAKKYRRIVGNVVDLASIDLNATTMAMGGAETKFIQLNSSLEATRHIEESAGQSSFEGANASYQQVLLIFIGILVMAVVASIAASVRVARMISRPLSAMNAVLDRVAERNTRLNEAAQQIAAGHMMLTLESHHEDIDVNQNDEVGKLAEATKRIVDSQGNLQLSFARVTETLNALVDETSALSTKAIDGRLDARGNPERFEGGYRAIVDGVNRTLDAVIGPLNVAADTVDRISKGEIPAPITAEYRGDFGTIKKNLNRCIAAVNLLITDSKALAAAAVDGNLSARADASNHQGDFRKIVEGFNGTLDAVIKPVQDGTRVLGEMGRGDLTARVEAEYRGDHRVIAESINAVGSSLEKTLRAVWEAVEATVSAATEISSSTEEMAAGAQEQTSQAGEVASSVEEMTKTILENSRNAGVAAETAKQARESATQGGSVVTETVEGMHRIADVVNRSATTVSELGKSSDQIGEIIAVIDDIADQTNLLALNAAIEAARAGDQGRGFAVVADEVRKLAERTTKATKEIASMIRKIQIDTGGAVESMKVGTAEVKNGIESATRAGASLDGIVSTSQKVTAMVSQIAAASEKQSSAAEEIARNVEAISKVSGETAQGTHQIARAAEDLNRLTENLQRLVSGFTLHKQDEKDPDSHLLGMGKNGMAKSRSSLQQ
jgi:methyl-accepting chemotaxis protein